MVKEKKVEIPDFEMVASSYSGTNTTDVNTGSSTTFIRGLIVGIVPTS